MQPGPHQSTLRLHLKFWTLSGPRSRCPAIVFLNLTAEKHCLDLRIEKSSSPTSDPSRIASSVVADYHIGPHILRHYRAFGGVTRSGHYLGNRNSPSISSCLSTHRHTNSPCSASMADAGMSCGESTPKFGPRPLPTAPATSKWAIPRSCVW